MKRRKLLKIAIIAALLIAALTVTTVAANPHITRGEFFTSLGKTLGLTEEETANLSFSDYNNENKIVNALVNIKYLLGRNNGTLALGEELTIKDVDYIFSRIKWPEKIVTETKYVGGGTRYITEEKVVDYSEIAHDQLHPNHLFQLSASGEYKCIFKNCDVVAPAGTISIPTLPTGVVKTELTEDYAVSYLSKPENGESLPMKLNKTTAVVDEAFSIAVDAALFEYDGRTFTRIGFIDFFEKYSINIDPITNLSTLTGWYETTTDDYPLVKMLIVDTRAEE